MVLVHDGVFSPATCALLHTAACSRGLGHALFPRAEPQSPIEFALASYLDEIGDSGGEHVEYWSRQEWKHIEAHADVDEKAAARGEALRYPINGHVLYLSVGPLVRGPTCVWTPAATHDFGAMTSVPAVAGRVLRFDGHLQHAVPKPADVWLAPFVINQSGKSEDFMRSVVLFNVWDKPPVEVEREAPPEDATEELMASSRCEPRDAWLEAPRGEPAESGGTKTMKSVAARRSGAARSHRADAAAGSGRRGGDGGSRGDGRRHASRAAGSRGGGGGDTNRPTAPPATSSTSRATALAAAMKKIQEQRA